MTQSEFAKKLNLSSSAVTRLEKGERGLPSRTIQLVCLTFNVREQWLSEGIEPIFETKGAIEILEKQGAQPMFLKFAEKYLYLDKSEKQKVDEFFKIFL